LNNQSDINVDNSDQGEVHENTPMPLSETNVEGSLFDRLRMQDQTIFNTPFDQNAALPAEAVRTAQVLKVVKLTNH
jgi:hypothetical protein